MDLYRSGGDYRDYAVYDHRRRSGEAAVELAAAAAVRLARDQLLAGAGHSDAVPNPVRPHRRPRTPPIQISRAHGRALLEHDAGRAGTNPATHARTFWLWATRRRKQGGMMEPLREALPHPKARITGAVYLLYFLTAVSGALFMRGIVVAGDAAATAANLLAHESLFRLGLSTSLIAMALYVAVTALFYELFKPVNRSLSLVAAFVGLVGCVIQTVSYLFNLAPFAVVGGAPYLAVFNGQQLQALAFLFLKLQGQGETMGLVFSGLYDLLIGCLICRSTFLPRILG